MAPQIIIATGQRRLRSDVGVQTDWALPLARLPSGNSGDGLTILVAAVMRLSQKTSRAFELSPAGFAFRGAGFLGAALPSLSGASLGNSSFIVVSRSQAPEDSLRTSASPAGAPNSG